MTHPSDARTVQALLTFVAGGAQPDYLFFWGHRPEKDGRIGKGCLSQWWPASFEVDRRVYPSAEHFMMAEKARLFGDERTRDRVLQANTPNDAKRLGRQVEGFSEEKWKAARFDIVLQASLAKFGQDAALRDYLLATGDRVLVEASPVDAIWGIGLAGSDRNAPHPENWPGLNLLGFALMEARLQLRG